MVDVAPSRGRGLKLMSLFSDRRVDPVAPSRGRGLKQSDQIPVPGRNRRPFTGAWIETAIVDMEHRFLVVAPSRGRGLKLRYNGHDVMS